MSWPIGKESSLTDRITLSVSEGTGLTRNRPLADAQGYPLLSSPRESHPEALPELYVSVSTHTAPMVKNRLRCCSQSASMPG